MLFGKEPDRYGLDDIEWGNLMTMTLLPRTARAFSTRPAPAVYPQS